MKSQANSDTVLNGAFYIFITIFAAFCLLPFILVVVSSFTDEVVLMQDGFRLFPRKFSAEAYRFVFKTNKIFNAYKVTIFVTVAGTAMSLLFTTMLAYPLSASNVKYRNRLAFYVYFTMLFHGGLVPSYILISRYLHLRNNIWVLIIPALISPWNMFLMRNFFRQLPESFVESAKIDGANDMVILRKIILPISLPSMATIGLFYALAYWNEWFRVLLYIDDSKLFSLQYLIMAILRSASFVSDIAQEGGITDYSFLPTYSVRMATLVVAIGPIVFVYPFIQKYFVKGLTVGGIKG
jgi:multiple sugar transport system permease protein/putative aldouronate transport system permease protein